MEKVIQYKPSDDNRAFLLKEQFKKNQKGSYLGLNRIVDIIISKYRQIVKNKTNENKDNS